MIRKGVDTSHHNPVVDLSTLKANGTEFLGLKATEGTGYLDNTFAARRARAHAVGFGRYLLYHFFHPTMDSQAQARRFAAAVGAIRPGEVLVIDLESAGTPDEWRGLSGRQSRDAVFAFMAALKGALGLRDASLMVYGSLGWLHGQFGDSLADLTAWRLWRAAYGLSETGDVSKLTSSAPWPETTIWQYSQYGTAVGAGAPRTVDLDLWISDEAWAA